MTRRKHEADAPFSKR